MHLAKQRQYANFFNIDAQLTVLIVALNKTRANETKEFIETFFSESNFLWANILIVLEGHVDIENNSMIMWKVFNNLDPKRDFYFKGDRLGVDATKKYKEEGYQQNWPEEIEMSEEIKTRVDSKWNSMFGK